MARPVCRGSGRRRRGGEPTGRRPRSPRAGSRGRGVGRTRAHSVGAHPQPARRGVGRRGGGAAECPGPRPSRPPKGCENRPRAGVGAGIKFPETRVARGPGRRVPPVSPQESRQSQVPPAPPPAPVLAGARGPLPARPRGGWYSVLLRGSRLLRVARRACPSFSPRPRPGRAARTLPAPRRPLPSGGRAPRGRGRGFRAGGALRGGGGSRRGTRGAAGVARAHCSVDRRAKPRGAPPTLLGAPPAGAPGVSSRVSQYTTPLVATSALGLRRRGGVLGYFLDARGLKARRQYKYKRCEDCSK